MVRKLLYAAAALFISVSAHAQVKQSGTVTPNHIPVWVTSGVIADGGTSADSPISSIGVTNSGGNAICANSARITAPGWNSLCLGVSTTGPAVISLQNYGTAAPQSLEFLINGVPLFPATIPLATPQQIYVGTNVGGVAGIVNLGTNLSITGGVLNASGGGGGGTPCVTTPLTLQYNQAGSFGCTTGVTYTGAGQLSIGTPGTTLGTAVFGNTVSGTITLEAATGVALGSSVLQLPATSGTLATLPNATTSQLFGGTGAAGSAAIVNVGSGLSLSGGSLTATGGGGGTGTAQRVLFCDASVWVNPPCNATSFTAGTTTSVTLPFTPTSATAVWVWQDAAYQDAYTYTVTGTTVTFLSPIPSNVKTVEVTAGTAAGAFSPGGSSTQVQYNSGSAFAATSSFTTNGNGQITLGTGGSTTGSVVFANTTSGSLTLQPPSSGALGSNTLTLPIANSTLAALGLAQTWTAAQTFSNNDLQVLGSSTGVTTVGSANASATNYTITFPAVNGQVLTTGNTLTVPQGGTGDATLTAYAPLFGGTTTTAAIQSGTLGTAGQVLTSNGSGALPTFQASAASNGSRYTNAVTTCGADPTGVTDSSTAITTCLASSATSALAFPQGTYLACNVQIVNQNTSIVGVGVLLSNGLPAGSSTGGTVFRCNSTTQSVFVLATTGPTTLFMQGFSCTKLSSVTPSSGSCVSYVGSPSCGSCTFRDLFAENQYNAYNLPPASAGWIDNVWAFNNYHDGFICVSSCSYSSIGMIAILNSGYGIELVNTGGTFYTYGQWTNGLTFANGLGGLFAHASGAGSTINDLFLANWTSSTDNADCVAFSTNGGTNLNLNGGLIEGCGSGVGGGGVGRNQSVSPSHTGNGVNFAGTNFNGAVQNMTISGASANGIGTGASLTSIIISGNYLYDNAVVASLCGANCNGILIGGSATQAVVSANTSLSGANMAYSLFSNSGSSFMTATGNSFVAGLSGTCGGTTYVKSGNVGAGC